VEVCGNGAEAEGQQEKVEGVEGPTKETCGKGGSLDTSQGADLADDRHVAES
jgi:hypothetical protein